MPSKINFKKLVAKDLDHWSYSAWSQFTKCAFAFYWKYIMGAKEDISGSPAIQRGIMLHAKAEGYLKGEVTVLPKELWDFKMHYKQLKVLSPIVEEFWGVDKRWRPIKWKSWTVMKMDAALAPSKKNGRLLWIQDLKSGREYPDHDKQSELYVAIGFAIHPNAKKIETEFWYADQGYSVVREYTKDDVADLVNVWIKRGKKVLEPRDKSEYLPTPSEDNCRWCFIRSDRGGPCDAWKKIGRSRGRSIHS